MSDGVVSEMREAWCAGRPVQVSARPAPADHRQVACKACGAKRGLDCVVIGGGGALLYAGHQVRQQAARLMAAALAG